MDVELTALALCIGFGAGFLLLAGRSTATAVQLRVRGLRVTGVVTARAAADRRGGGLVVFPDHLGRRLVLDPGRYGRLYGLPPAGGSVPVVFVRERPTAARVWTMRHLLGPAFGWFLSSAVAFGTGVVIAS
ncbi:hypothetical protein [Streptomyces antibioticus]|uniref:hypothetical protein n=1 Tax=Streptomyces antibioticus TaxID=1890 RepID=UPI002258427C|nr:hypothetical protein [Streptomyces antibioticus]MCX4737460.1 hypothetical protein [Streptomyces antibioticus]